MGRVVNPRRGQAPSLDAVHPRSVLMRIEITRSRWAVFGGFTLVCLANLRLAIGEKDIGDEGRAHAEEATRQHVCCARHERMIDVGYGISGEIIQIDAGHCRKVCPRHALDDPGDASRPLVQKCNPESHCRPSAAKLEGVSTIQGVRGIEVTEACECTPDSTCKRETFTHLVHSGTPHQAVMDVGVCMGRCGKDLGCKPVRNGTISIVGPNGDEVYQVIKKCGCAETCHKMDHMETVLDYSEVEIKDGTNTTDVRPVVLHINVGKCVGTCPGNEKEMCLLRDKKEPSRCLAGLYSKQRSCTPAKFKVHEYRTRRGLKREIIQITQCACV